MSRLDTSKQKSIKVLAVPGVGLAALPLAGAQADWPTRPMREAINQALSHLSTEACVARLSEAQMVVGAANRYGQAATNADIQACGVVVDATDATGQGYRMLGLPTTVDGQSRRAPPAAPSAGEHTGAMLAEAGLSAEKCRELRAAGVT